MTQLRVPATFDTNNAIFTFDDLSEKAAPARQILPRASFISVQVLNEFANVTVRKGKRSWTDAAWGVDRLRKVVPAIRSIGPAENAEALRMAECYRLSFYDALMPAVALAGGARTIYSEDMRHGLVIDDTLRIADPFR